VNGSARFDSLVNPAYLTAVAVSRSLGYSLAIATRTSSATFLTFFRVESNLDPRGVRRSPRVLNRIGRMQEAKAMYDGFGKLVGVNYPGRPTTTILAGRRRGTCKGSVFGSPGFLGMV
jgi:hypothetical protein